MSNTSKSTRYCVVVGVDYSPTGRTALHKTFELTNKAGGEPHVVSVGAISGPMLRLEMPDTITVITIEEASAQLTTYVEAELAEFQKTHVAKFERVVSHVRMGGAAHEIAQLAADLDADLVVVGTHGRRGVQRFLLGSVAETTVRLATCPVLVVRPKDHTQGLAIPAIEPPCPRCVEERRATGGKELWCAQHREKHGRRHSYHFLNRMAESRENMPLVT